MFNVTYYERFSLSLARPVHTSTSQDCILQLAPGFDRATHLTHLMLKQTTGLNWLKENFYFIFFRVSFYITAISAD